VKITCLNCGEQYLVEASQIKPEGTKVRCSECDMIFLAYPPALAERNSTLSVEYPGEPSRIVEPDSSNVPLKEKEPVQFSGKMNREPSYLRIDDEKELEEDVSFGVDKISEKEDFSFEKKETKFSSTEGWSQGLPPELREPLLPKAKTSCFQIIGYGLLILGLAVLVSIVCLLVTMRFFNVNLPPCVQKVVELPVLRDLAQIQPHTGPTIALVKGSGKATRILTEEGNHLLIITGELQNISKIPQGFLSADVQLFQKGTPILIATQSFYCGNKMDVEEIKAIPFHDVQQRVRQPFGKNRSNASVLPKAKIEFMAVMKAPEIPVDIIVQAGSAKPIQ